MKTVKRKAEVGEKVKVDGGEIIKVGKVTRDGVYESGATAGVIHGHYEVIEDEPAIPPHSTAASEEVALNPILREIHWKIVSQTEKGLKKYGKPVHPDNHSLTEWIDHAVEESIDHITYLLMMKKKIEEGAE